MNRDLGEKIHVNNYEHALYLHSHERGYCSHFICNFPHSPNEIASCICMCIVHFRIYLNDAGYKMAQLFIGFYIKSNF